MAHPALNAAAQPFSVAGALKACRGTVIEEESESKPIRVLVPCEGGQSYKIVPYTGQTYVAISYCWPSAAFAPVGCSATPVALSPPSSRRVQFTEFMRRTVEQYHAEHAVLLAMPPGAPLAVWIDQHCIDQDNTAEKAQQVAVMHRIYQRAQTTFVALEDTQLSPAEHAILSASGRTDAHIALVRRIVAARWFSRAWCSQELVLSARANVCVHQTGVGDRPLRIPADTLWHWMDAARMRDRTIPVFAVARGHVPGAFARGRFAWALGVVHSLGCYNEYDKAVLVANLVRLAYRFDALPEAPDAKDAVAHTVHENVIKMVNVLAVAQRDFSLLLANHVPPHLEGGFGWAGRPVFGDKISEMCVAKDYEVVRDPDVHVDEAGLVARGTLARIVRVHSWEIRRESEHLRVSVDGLSVPVPPSQPPHVSWTWTDDVGLLRDLLLALAVVGDAHADAEIRNHASVALAYIFETDYTAQPPPIQGALVPVVEDTLSTRPGELQHIARALAFIRADGPALTFTTLIVDDGKASVLLVRGPVAPPDLTDKLLFQPWVVRPKVFSLPIILTANAMVLENLQREGAVATGEIATHRCVGCVRGLGMVSADAVNAQIRVV